MFEINESIFKFLKDGPKQAARATCQREHWSVVRHVALAWKSFWYIVDLKPHSPRPARSLSSVIWFFFLQNQTTRNNHSSNTQFTGAYALTPFTILELLDQSQSQSPERKQEFKVSPRYEASIGHSQRRRMIKGKGRAIIQATLSTSSMYTKKKSIPGKWII